MKAVHVLNGAAAEKDVPGGEVSFFLSNNTGGFAHFAASSLPTSKFQGFFAKVGSSLFKTVEGIRPVSDDRTVAVENAGCSALLNHSTFYEHFFIPLGRNCLVYQLSRELPVELSLDVRRASDFRQWGRHYHSYEQNGVFVVEFAKKTDGKEDSNSGKDEFSVFVAVKHDGFIVNNNSEWVKRDYSLDRRRNSASERHVYKAAAIEARTFAIASSGSAAAAIKEACSVFKSLNQLEKAAKAHYDRLCAGKPRNETGFAVNAARIALDKLRASNGLYAGLPWFFQEWSRDEMVSCAALPAAAKKKIVLKYLDKALDDGRLPNITDGNYKPSPNGSADSIGWLFKRASELLDRKAFTPAERKRLQNALKKSIDALLKNHQKNGFITNEKNETWMDTGFKDDGRSGVCIEIQAMQLNMYNLMHRLSKDKTYLLLEKSLRQNVRKFFWNGSILADRLNDFTVRPNIFIAACIYPQLLSVKEWEACMQNTLSKLWLDWGGIATIDQSHPSFKSEYTGETNESYHRGDSWFWLNNIAAIVMHSINRKRFGSYIKKIAAASANDILWNGAIGCASELSSAKEQRAEGCLNQAWSNATFIELASTVAILGRQRTK
ncbi:hypothetical protein HYU17_04300 [Candidatus Woesearchaeota archaeon]|nr:hypothetical protein [Candidatus Woesearchaeota archaeon]